MTSNSFTFTLFKDKIGMLALLLCIVIFLVGCKSASYPELRDNPIREFSTSNELKSPSHGERDRLQQELAQERRKREAAEKLISELQKQRATKPSSAGNAPTAKQAYPAGANDIKDKEEELRILRKRLVAQIQLTKKAEASAASLRKQLDEEKKARERAEEALKRIQSTTLHEARVANESKTEPSSHPSRGHSEAMQSKINSSTSSDNIDTKRILARVLILANDLYRDRNYSMALQLFRIATDSGIKDGETYFRLGKCLAQLDKNDEAIEAYQTACECFETNLHPEGERRQYHAYSYNNLGTLLRRKGKYAEAAKAYEKAVEIMPSYAGAFYNLGVLYNDFLNDSEKAASNFRKHIELGGERAHDAQRYLDHILGKTKNN